MKPAIQFFYICSNFLLTSEIKYHIFQTMSLKTLSLLVASVIVLQGNLKAVIINGVDWTNAYQPNATTNNNLPTAAAGVTGGAWTLGTATGTVGITDDYFSIATTATTQNQWYSNTSNWSATTGMTVEARIQMATAISPLNPVGQIRLGGASNKFVYLSFSQTTLYYGAGQDLHTIASGLSLDNFTTFRFTLSSDLSNTNLSALTIYMNNNPTPLATLSGAVFTATAGTTNILFGDITGTGTTAAGGTSNWNYIAYTQGIIPVPEPHSFALIALAGIVGLVAWRSGYLRKKMV